LTLTASWQAFTVKWTDLKQLGAFGPVATFDAKTIYGFQWQVDQKATTFDYWVDDLSFVK